MSNLFVICGQARTFIDCFDSCYNKIINILSPGKKYIFFYLKLNNDPPKKQKNWAFSYEDIPLEKIKKKINQIKTIDNVEVYCKIVEDNEISDEELMKQCKDRSKYIDFLSIDQHLIRTMNCHYNFELCGNYIREYKKENNLTFDNYIYIRPDLFFTKRCKFMHIYNKNKINFGFYNQKSRRATSDHIAIIPEKCFEKFFYDRMKIYRNNDSIFFNSTESIYFHNNIKDKYCPIGNYFIKRN